MGKLAGNKSILSESVELGKHGWPRHDAKSPDQERGEWVELEKPSVGGSKMKGRLTIETGDAESHFLTGFEAQCAIPMLTIPLRTDAYDGTLTDRIPNTLGSGLQV